MPFILARIFREIWLPAFIQFGQAENTDTTMVVKACEIFLESEFKLVAFLFFDCQYFHYSIEINLKFHFVEQKIALDCDTITKKAVALEIDSEFYAENLSDQDKIEATSENRELVNIVEKVSMEWMRIIEKILIKGKVIRRNAWDTGPIDELEHWLQTHSMYSIAQELMSKKSFLNHMKCLTLSGSKLVNVSFFYF